MGGEKPKKLIFCLGMSVRMYVCRVELNKEKGNDKHKSQDETASDEAQQGKEGHRALRPSRGGSTGICDGRVGVCFIIMRYDLDIQFFPVYQVSHKLKNGGVHELTSQAT